MTTQHLPGRQQPVRAENLGKAYRRGWALQDCSVVLPADRLIALVGPNGAGKSTFMGLITGLLRPSAGAISVFGDQPTGTGMHPSVAFLAQQKPLYPQFTVAETLQLGQRTNPGWDQSYAEDLVRRAQVPLTAKVGTLSGGQRTRVALALALGKRPKLLLLDEPLADLDPLARHTVLQSLVEESRRHGITVLLSSHVLAELEGVCDHLLLLAGGRVRLAGDVDRLLAEHAVLAGPANGLQPVPSAAVVDAQRSDAGLHLLVHAGVAPHPPGWRQFRPTLGQLALGYMRNIEAEVAA
jgi:ABC-2 type transport system ATP-binding protein